MATVFTLQNLLFYKRIHNQIILNNSAPVTFTVNIIPKSNLYKIVPITMDGYRKVYLYYIYFLHTNLPISVEVFSLMVWMFNKH